MRKPLARDSRMLHTTSIVSWIALSFVGLGEFTEFASWAKATDRVETCEVLEDTLHEVEAELTGLRQGSCWILHFRCRWTCSLMLLASLIVAILAASWCCVRSCTRRTNVVVEMGHEWLSLRPSGRNSEREGAQHSWWEVSEVWSVCSPSLLWI